jgi:hypothetical protein
MVDTIFELSFVILFTKSWSTVMQLFINLLKYSSINSLIAQKTTQ